MLGIQLAGASMGGELSTKLKPGLVYNRHIIGYAAGTDLIQEIAIIRNGEIIHLFHPQQSIFEFTFDDSEVLDKVALASPGERPHFAYYYLRLLQKDGHIAWSTPIWIDYPDMNVSSAANKKSRKK